MIKNVSVKTKLLLPIFSLITVLLFLGTIIIISNYDKITSLNTLNKKIIFSTVIANTLHALQKERGLSTGYLTNSDNKFKEELLKQRKITDLEIQKMRDFLDTITSQIFKNYTNTNINKLQQLTHIRAEIDKQSTQYNSITNAQAIKIYSQINSSLLDVIVNVAKSSHIPIITQNILSCISFLYLKEYTGIERAQGVAILSEKEFKLNSFIYFTNLIALQKQNEAMFLKYASKEIQDIYHQKIKIEKFQEIKRIEETIIKNYMSKTDINSKYWYDTISVKLETYDFINSFIEKNTTQKIMIALKDAQRFFILIIFLTSISLVIFTIMLLALLKLVKDERRLRIVMDKYIISSVANIQGNIIDVSEAFCNISGYTREELLGKNHNIVRHPDMPNIVFKEMWDKIKIGESWSGKIKNKNKNDEFYWVFANIEPLYNSKGIIDSYISIRLDITENELLTQKIKEEEEKNRLQEEVMQQQHRLAQMGEMLSMIAHQWRQPLSAITAATGVIHLKAQRGKLDNETAIDLSNKIKNFSLHLSSTIDDFRNFFKSNKTKKVTTYKKILEDVLLIIENSLEKNNIKIVQNIISIEEFSTYENELKQVLLNLIKNAEDALLENNVKNPNIIITIDKNTLSVTDNAGGIAEDILNRIFEPYFSTKLKKDGTGLGLYMSKLIVEDHCEGKLMVKNINEGVCFRITLEKDNG